MSHSNFSISSQLNEIISRDFATMRQMGVEFTSNDLDKVLCVARYMCLSDGASELKTEHWTSALALEQLRKKRL
jgi:hypothetical protein